nr:hypothetical protein GCM10020092_090230 [Actinoplanes digitatis]
MIDADTYLKGLADRLAGDGCAVTHEELGLVGYKAQFKALSRMHVFLVAAKADRVGEAEVNGFTDAAVRLAVARKGKWSGAQSGVIVLPVLVAAAADESAVALTRRAHRLNLGGFATMAQLAVVDLAAKPGLDLPRHPHLGLRLQLPDQAEVHALSARAGLRRGTRGAAAFERVAAADHDRGVRAEERHAEGLRRHPGALGEGPEQCAAALGDVGATLVGGADEGDIAGVGGEAAAVRVGVGGIPGARYLGQYVVDCLPVGARPASHNT